MSDRRWVKAFLSGLLVLNLSHTYGLFHDCFISCEIQEKTRDLNCSWRSDVWTQYSVFLQDLTNTHNPSLLFTNPPGRNWQVTLRKDLVLCHEYNITVTGDGTKQTENFMYSNDGYNIIIQPPQLYSSILESESIQITWRHPEDVENPNCLEAEPLQVGLRYRIRGADNWTEVDDSDLQINTYILDDPVLYTDYEFQIRYLPDKKKKRKGSPWSEGHVLTSPEKAPNGSCDVWRSLQNGSSLQIMWKELDHRCARGRILGYQVTYEKTTTEVPCCSMILPFQSTPVFIRARNSMGLGPPACVPPICTEIANTTTDCEVWGDSRGRLNVLCEEPLTPDNPLSYIIEWGELRENERTEVRWTRSQAINETFVLPGEFTSGVPYYVSVYVLYNNSCIRTFSAEAYSQEEVPDTAPNFTSHILSVGNVLVSWEEIPRRHRKGIISHHTIYINSTDHAEDHRVSNRSGNKTLSGLSPGTVYNIWMTASTRGGEGQSSPHKTFQMTGNRHRTLLIVPVVINILFVCGAVLCFCDCGTPLWPKIPRPEDKFKKLFMASSVNMWQPQQVSLSPPITVVEEIEPPPQPPTPPPPPSPPSTLLNKAPVIISGYEKHFMPTPEEVIGFR
ncbi:interleukin-27 receptor subunit alpha isoform X1 [Bufo bufo]|uniref:interleukin-27 receptor subunit alpha isoform X1 n=1 Tax=Bufo bufo TaxID=8384 RepID=UPI001ABEBF04|nr:interleukin-27 receptor subunit alpha isoform X1 [Bufo bufo]